VREFWDHAVQHIAQEVRNSDPMPSEPRKDLLMGIIILLSKLGLSACI